MTQNEKEAEVGRVVLEIQQIEQEIRHPVGKLQGFAETLRTAAKALEATYGEPGDYSRYNTSGSPTIGGLPNVDDIIRLENEVRDLGPRLVRLRSRRSQLGL